MRIIWLTLVFAGAVIGQGKVAEKQTSLPSPKGPRADNSFCFVCHMNFEEESLTQRHAEANVGCVKCHGLSRAHASDEAHLTPPDIMYPKEKISPGCLKCHASENLSAVHKAILEGSETKNKLCTDCHGEHRLRSRERRWNKTTREFIPASEGPGK